MRVGINAETGELMTGWAHCAQSIGKCLTTRFRSRVMRRHYGSFVPELQDDNADAATIMRVYMAIAEALADPKGGEPGFRLTGIELAEGGRSGRFFFILSGVFYPEGHLGNFEVFEDRTLDFAAAGLIQ